MKKAKRTLAMILATVMSLALVACGNTNSADTSAEKKQFIIAHAMTEESCFGDMTDAIEKVLTDSGLFDVQVYPNAQLGSDSEGIQATQSGNITLYPTYHGTWASYASPFYVFDRMFATSDGDVARAVADDEEFLAVLNTELEGSGVYCLGLSDMGFRKMTCNKPINSLDDLKGIKIRVVENPIYLAAWSAIGCNPTPVAFTELYSSLQQGVVDAQENPIEVTYSCKAYEAQKYIVDTNHIFHYIAMNINRDYMNNLTDEERAVVEEAVKAGIDASRAKTDNAADERLALFAEAGCEHVSIPDDVVAQIKEIAAGTWGEAEQKVSPELYAAYTTALERAGA